MRSHEDWFEREISKIAKRKLRDFNGPVPLEGIIEEVECRFRHPVGKDYVLQALEASKKMGAARYVLFDGMVDLSRTQERISRQSKRLLGEGAGLSLEKLTEELQAWVDSRLEPVQVLHAILHSAKNGVPRFRMDKGLIYLKARESKWPAPPPQLGQQVFERMKRLDSTVGTRPHRRLEEGDRAAVSELGALMKAWISEPAWLEAFDATIMVDEVPDIMVRVHLYTNDIQVRLHYFMNVNETIIHNHRSDFFSHCLHGEYWHRIWGHKGPGEHFSVNRSLDPAFERPSRSPTGLDVLSAHTYKAGGTYFIQADTPHTVYGEDAPVVTLYIKHATQTADTIMRAKSMQEIRDFRSHQAAEDRRLEGGERWEALRRIHRLFQAPLGCC